MVHWQRSTILQFVMKCCVQIAFSIFESAMPCLHDWQLTAGIGHHGHAFLSVSSNSLSCDDFPCLICSFFKPNHAILCDSSQNVATLASDLTWPNLYDLFCALHISIRTNSFPLCWMVLNGIPHTHTMAMLFRRYWAIAPGLYIMPVTRLLLSHTTHNVIWSDVVTSPLQSSPRWAILQVLMLWCAWFSITVVWTRFSALVIIDCLLATTVTLVCRHRIMRVDEVLFDDMRSKFRADSLCRWG